MRELSLFTGAGGGLLGTKLLGWEPCGYVEWDEYCQRVIAARIRDGYLPVAPIFTDVREFVQSGAARQYRGVANVLSAGFPCQPFSASGKRLGVADKRNMWPATAAAIRSVRPEIVWLENVPRLVSNDYFQEILGELSEMGFHAKWGCLSAGGLGAPHLRERVWVLAYTDSAQCEGRRISSRIHQEHANAGGCSWWEAEPGMDRVADGMAYRVDRLKAIGNGQVPTMVEKAWKVMQ